MNDDALTIALDRMATALEPPVAADDLINARRSQLRRRRRVTTGLTAASVFAIIATGGVVANGLGSADPAPDGVPVTSDGPAPSDAADAAATGTEVRENDGPWHCTPGDEGAMTPAEVEAFRNKILDESQLSADFVDNKIRAYVVIPEDGNVVYELDVRRAGANDFEIVSVVRCAD